MCIYMYIFKIMGYVKKEENITYIHKKRSQ